jgi:hypothetical protein
MRTVLTTMVKESAPAHYTETLAKLMCIIASSLAAVNHGATLPMTLLQAPIVPCCLSLARAEIQDAFRRSLHDLRSFHRTSHRAECVLATESAHGQRARNGGAFFVRNAPRRMRRVSYHGRTNRSQTPVRVPNTAQARLRTLVPLHVTRTRSSGSWRARFCLEVRWTDTGSRSSGCALM